MHLFTKDYEVSNAKKTFENNTQIGFPGKIVEFFQSDIVISDKK